MTIFIDPAVRYLLPSPQMFLQQAVKNPLFKVHYFMSLPKLALWLGFLLAISLLQTPLAEAKTHKILVFGDSLSSAYNMPIEKGWVSLLERSLIQHGQAVTLVNASISGETSSGALAGFLNTLDLSQPDILILELGANDGLRGSSLRQLEDNLAKMIELSVNRGVKVLLTGMHIPPNYGRTYTQAFDQVYIKLAQEYPITFMPFLLVGVATNDHLFQADGLHPNESAQVIIEKNIRPFVLALLNDE